MIQKKKIRYFPKKRKQLKYKKVPYQLQINKLRIL